MKVLGTMMEAKSIESRLAKRRDKIIVCLIFCNVFNLLKEAYNSLWLSMAKLSDDTKSEIDYTHLPTCLQGYGDSREYFSSKIKLLGKS